MPVSCCSQSTIQTKCQLQVCVFLFRQKAYAYNGTTLSHSYIKSYRSLCNSNLVCKIVLFV